MDLTRRAVALCAEGTTAEFEGRIDDARRLYTQAWTEAVDDYDRTVAAHYIAHLESDPATQLDWNLRALEHARRSDPELVAALLGSLYVNLGHSHELTGNQSWADKYYRLAADHGVIHQP